MALVLMKPHNFMPRVLWVTAFADTAQLRRTARREGSSALFLLGVERETRKIPLFLSIQNVEEPFPHFMYLLQGSEALPSSA